MAVVSMCLVLSIGIMVCMPRPGHSHHGRMVVISGRAAPPPTT